MPSCDEALARLCSPEFEVSAHYLISENGDVFQMVAEEMRAWHAGVGAWGSCIDVNSHSIGIELDNTGSTSFSEPLMASLEALLGGIMSRWSIPPERVIGHADMAPDRKSDPGCRFDWQRLALRGQSVWPNATSNTVKPDMSRWRAHAAQFGYSARAEISDQSTLHAFRDRFRSGKRGPLDSEDMRIIHNLSHRFPVDAGETNP